MLVTSPFRKVRLGDLLVKSGLLTEEKLKSALKIQMEQGGKLGDVLIRLKYVSEAEIIKALTEQLKIPFIDLKKYQIKTDVIHKLPERIARRYQAIVLDTVKGEYTVGMVDPTDLVAYDEIAQILNGNVKTAIVKEQDLLHLFDMVYRKTEEIASFAQALKEEIGKAEESDELETISAEGAPVVKLLNSIFEDAVQIGASDIHIEPDENSFRIRQRVDGVLHEHVVQGKEIIAALILRIKLVSNMDISERRLPQEGRFAKTVKGHYIDVRVASMPVTHGEAIVLRLLDQSKGILKLEQIGMSDHLVEKIRHLIYKPHGMILVTGPTGSGKTTTLYAALSELNTAEKKIITIEDPVEYMLPRINQVQVNQAIDLTFASVLRIVVRHDPDIIMVGEIRDEETVLIALRAAMTGHLVFSTLHTNDAASSAVRLIDMGARGFLIASALRGILAQRLIRKICESCAVPYLPTEAEQAWIAKFQGNVPSAFSFKQGTGCSRCNKTGYRGRTGVYEYLEITPELSDALRTNDINGFLKLASEQPDFKTIEKSAFDFAVQGVTTLTEVFRITGVYV